MDKAGARDEIERLCKHEVADGDGDAHAMTLPYRGLAVAFGIVVLDVIVHERGFVQGLDRRHQRFQTRLLAGIQRRKHGYAVGLDYRNPRLEPHELFRRFKATKAVQAHIAGGRPVAYGAKLIPEGGYYALPRPYAPGALIVGDGAGLVDGLRIKGVHLAMESGVAAAKAILDGIEGCGERYQALLKSEMPDGQCQMDATARR